jgi:imidazoleglycerol-phosphate dehydratase/histidinol-phosphatase
MYAKTTKTQNEKRETRNEKRETRNLIMKKVLFIDRDGTLIKEPPVDFQVDSLEKLEFYPGVFRNLYGIKKLLPFELVIVSNQDGLGTDSFPYEDFIKPHNKFLEAFRNEGIIFDNILIDKSFPVEESPDRKPRTGMFGQYLNGDYDLSDSYVIGDRLTDIELAGNLGSKGIFIGKPERNEELIKAGLEGYCALITESWDEILEYLVKNERKAKVLRKTNETMVSIQLELDGTGKSDISTSLGFFDHMLNQIPAHSGCNLDIKVRGDLHVDEHHTIEDTALALGEAFNNAMGDKKGIQRYGFMVPMDDCLAQVVIDFGGRNWLVWDADFKREKVGDVPTELFFHFFKSFTDTARCNLNIKAEGDNEHHKIEGIFKAFARAIKMAVQRDINNDKLPSSKGML